MSGLIQTLVDVQSKDAQTRANASNYIDSAQHSNPAQFLHELAVILGSDAAPKLARSLAGLMFKNTIKNSRKEDALIDTWARVDPVTKAQIRTYTLSTLASTDKDIRQSAAQAVASIASQDIPVNAWPDILSVLVTNARNANPVYKQASLVTLGFICEELAVKAVSKVQSDQILTAIADSLGPDEPNAYIKLDALKALNNVLRFACSNFQSDPERDYLLRALCACACHPDHALQIQAFETLCDVVMLYYDFVGPNLSEIWQVTSGAMERGDEQVAVLAVEVWNTVGDVEKDRKGGNGFLAKATPTLLPLLLSAIVRFQPQDEQDWGMRKASTACLSRCASLSGDLVVEPCIVFIAQHINSPDWLLVDASVLIFGSILEGPSKVTLRPAVDGGIETMLRLMTRTEIKVRETAAWVLGTICEKHFEAVERPETINLMMPVLLRGLLDHPKVAIQICGCCVKLVDNPKGLYPFGPHNFKAILGELITIIQRTDRSDSQRDLEITAFSALLRLIEKAPESCVQLLETQIPHVLILLRGSTTLPVSESFQAYICSVLENICLRVQDAFISEADIDGIVNGIISVFNLRRTVLEEGIKALSALAQLVGVRLKSHIARITPFVFWAIKARNDAALCKAGTICLGDISSAFDEIPEMYVSEIIPLLLTNLELRDISADIKVYTVATLGDLFCNSASTFLPYLPQVLELIEQAAETSAQPNPSSELEECLIDLREAIVQFYLGLFHGLRESKQVSVIASSVHKIIDFALFASQENLNVTDHIRLNVLGLIGEVIDTFGTAGLGPISRTSEFVNRLTLHSNEKIKATAVWTQETLVRLQT